MSNDRSASGQPSADPTGDAIARALGAVLLLLLAVVALPLVIPALVNLMVSDIIATRTKFWLVWKWQWLANLIGITSVVALVGIEATILGGWIQSGEAKLFFAGAWLEQLLPAFGPWAIVNLVSGVLLIPVLWSVRRRRIADQVRTRRIPDVLRQEKIEGARKRAADSATAQRIGVRLDSDTGRILGLTDRVLSVPHEISGRQSFGFINLATVRGFADRFHDIRKMRDFLFAKLLVSQFTVS